MPQMKFTTENKKASVNYDYPKMKLKNGERARIAVLQEPEVQYVHNFRKPVIEAGRPKMETAKRRDNSEYQTNVMKFIRNPICRGDFSKLEDAGIDPVNCPACKMAKEHPDWMAAPKRRFAMHVLRYRTKSGSFAVADPFAVETLVWSFTDRVFGKLVEYGEEVGDLKNADLLLGPCENEGFQKFDITIGTKAEWQADDETRKLSARTLKGGLIPDLNVAIGNSQTEAYMKTDLEEIQEAWVAVQGNVREESSGSLSDGLGDLFDSKPASNKPDDRQSSQGDDWSPAPTEDTASDETPKSSTSDDDLLGNLLGSSPDADEEKESKPASKKDEGMNFDDLLDSINV